MGMNMYVVGFRAPDARWRVMKGVWDACHAAGVPVPDEVRLFFAGAPPDDRGVVVDIQGSACCKSWSNEPREGFEVELAGLPPGLTHLRFYHLSGYRSP